MSGAQPKAGNISGVVSVTAEINPLAARKRYEQGWVDEIHEDLDELIPRIRRACADKEVVSLAYQGNIVESAGPVQTRKWCLSPTRAT